VKIVHLCAPAQFGGLETVIQTLGSRQHQRGHETMVVAVVEPDADPAPFLDPLKSVGVETRSIVLPARAYIREITRIRAALLAEPPDILHTHGYRPDLLHGWWARRAGIATVTTLHGFSMMGGVSSLLERLQRRVVGGFDAVVAVSSPISDALVELGVPRERVHVVPNAWTPPVSRADRSELEDVLGPKRNEKRMGWVGRLYPIKGCDVFLDALARLEAEGWHACVIGDGPERRALEARADELGLADRIRFTGAIPDAARLFAGLDLFVLSSRSEGTPMVLLEAMGAGVPVVASAVGGVPDVLRPPAEGWLVPPEDPAALAAAIEEALRDEGLRTRVAEAGRARVHHEFDQDVWAERHDAVYRAAMAVSEGR